MNPFDPNDNWDLAFNVAGGGYLAGEAAVAYINPPNEPIGNEFADQVEDEYRIDEDDEGIADIYDEEYFRQLAEEGEEERWRYWHECYLRREGLWADDPDAEWEDFLELYSDDEEPMEIV